MVLPRPLRKSELRLGLRTRCWTSERKRIVLLQLAIPVEIRVSYKLSVQ